jgi:hypothetical protein
MMVFHYLDDDEAEHFDEHYVDEQVAYLGQEATELWQEIKNSAREHAARSDD